MLVEMVYQEGRENGYRRGFDYYEKAGLKMRFIDLFAGVGGFRLGLERAGHTCVWSKEWDKQSNARNDEQYRVSENISTIAEAVRKELDGE